MKSAPALTFPLFEAGRMSQRPHGWRALLLHMLVAVLSSVVVAAGSGAARADRWSFDPEHTRVTFSWDHLGVSRQSARIEKLTGQLDFNPTAPDTGQVEVSALASSLSSGVPALDMALKGPDFFDVARFGTITFKSTAVRALSDKTGEVIGDLTIRGLTQPVTLEVIWNFTGEHPLASFNPVYAGKWVSGFSAKAKVKRSAWGMTLAAPLVSDEVEIVIEAEFLRQGGTP